MFSPWSPKLFAWTRGSRSWRAIVQIPSSVISRELLLQCSASRVTMMVCSAICCASGLKLMVVCMPRQWQRRSRLLTDLMALRSEKRRREAVGLDIALMLVTECRCGVRLVGIVRSWLRRLKRCGGVEDVVRSRCGEVKRSIQWKNCSYVQEVSRCAVAKVSEQSFQYASLKDKRSQRERGVRKDHTFEGEDDEAPLEVRQVKRKWRSRWEDAEVALDMLWVEAGILTPRKEYSEEPSGEKHIVPTAHSPTLLSPSPNYPPLITYTSHPLPNPHPPHYPLFPCPISPIRMRHIRLLLPQLPPRKPQVPNLPPGLRHAEPTTHPRRVPGALR